MKLAFILLPGRRFYELPIYSNFEVLEAELFAEGFGELPLDACSGITYSKISFKRWPIFGRMFSASTALCSLKGCEKLLESADIVNTIEVYSSISYQCAKLCKDSQKKLVVSIWEILSDNAVYKFPPYRFFFHFVKKNADFLIAHTFSARNHLLQLGIKKERIKMIYPGIDLTKFHPDAEPRAKDKIRILFLGRLYPYKGVLVLLKAFERLSKEYEDTELLIVGSGPLKREVQIHASRNKNIRYLGYATDQKIAEIYRDASVFCYPSIKARHRLFYFWAEQFAYSAVEAMASGLPIVATDCGAIPEVVGDRNIIVKQGCIEDLYRGLRTLIKDEDLREKIGRENRRRVERLFDATKQAAIFEETMIQLLENA